MNRFEPLAFYPVAIVFTVLALQSWTAQPRPIPLIATVIAIGLWLTPLLPVRLRAVRKFFFWLAFAALFFLGSLLLLWLRV